MKKKLAASIVLYFFAVIMAVYSIWTIIYDSDIVSRAVETGQLVVKGYEYDIIRFYFTDCGQYVALTLLLAAAGIALWRIQPASKTTAASAAPEAPVEAKEKEEEKELDEWFSELDTKYDIEPEDK
jgi:hypothetical protein